MGIKKTLKELMISTLKKKGYELVPSSLIYEWQKYSNTKPSFKKTTLPPNANSYLRPDNPRLKELQLAYASVNSSDNLLWNEEHVKKEDIQYFRGDNAYVYQLRGTNMNVLGYALTTYFIKSIDKFDLLDKLEEDDSFGNYIFKINGKNISRDLLDSINEIYFLEKHLNISSKNDLNILDIGAGYGRLAHRMVESFPNLTNYFCTDAIAVSSFIAEYYLRFRELKNASILPLNAIDKVLKNQKIDIAVNIHSFSECSIKAVDWWISLLAKYKIKYLMIVPNVYVNSGELLVSHDRQSISSVIKKHGYKLLVDEPKFGDPLVQKYGINPTSYFLFEIN